MAFEVAAEADVEFASEGGQPLRWDIYRPLGAEGSRPVALLFHGGGWRRGDRSRLADAASGLASRGYLALAVGYRLLSDEAPWPAQVHDVKSAVRVVRAGAADLGAASGQVALVGYSAGAHIALLAAATADSAEAFVGGDRAYGDQSEAVGAVAAFFPPVTAAGVGSMLGLDEAMARVAAPLEYASGSALPPVLFLHGTNDPLVPHEPNSVAMFDAIRASGGATDLRLFHALPHEFVRLPGMTDLTVHDVASFFDRHVVHPDVFSEALGDAERAWAERAAAARAR
ncbi:MAG: alpha/beta hydrolase fold domain-containing protein [Dehalococcoidia bacterium]|nr:alpha/beta hydrolase fold domain-containing protein [Dehalococcoidia bacterium]